MAGPVLAQGRAGLCGHRTDEGTAPPPPAGTLAQRWGRGAQK